MTHFHDNHGLKSEECWIDGQSMVECDEHNVPFDGIVDFEKHTRLVAGSPYELPIVLEVAKRNREEQKFLKDSLEAGIRITEMIQRKRG